MVAKQAERALVAEHHLIPHVTAPDGVPLCPLDSLAPLDIHPSGDASCENCSPSDRTAGTGDPLLAINLVVGQR